MALHKMWDRDLAVNQGAVMTFGYSLNLGKGQLGIFDVTPESQTKKGNPAVSDFSNQPKNRKFEIKVGTHDALSRSRHNKSKATIPFRLSDIQSISVSAPDMAHNQVDSFIVGYDGRVGTELKFQAGESTELGLTLSGAGIGALGYVDSKVTLKAYFKAPKLEADINNEKIVMDAIKQLKGRELLGGYSVQELVEIRPVKDTSPANVADATPYKFFKLTVQDLGDSSALGLVQAQYPDYVVKRTDRTGLQSTYTILAPAGEEGVAAGSFVVGQEYTIASAGDTDFTAVGAADSEVGTTFVATGTGTGTGTADEVEVSAYTQGIASVIKGCEDCPAGFTEEGGGVIYNVTLEDDGADSTSTVQGIPGAKSGTASKEGQEDGVGIYVVVTDDELTQDEINTFVDSNPTAEVSKIGETEAICTNGTVSSTAWTESGECNATIESYTITLADDKCGNSRLSELQEAYPELTIAEDSAQACQRTYSTTVATNVVCEECDPIFRDTFESEAPEPFDFVEWEAEDPTYDADAKMGIRFTAKPVELGATSEALKYDIPFIDSSVRIAVAGGYPMNTNENFAGYKDGRFNVKLLSRAAERSNLGGDLLDYHRRSDYYFTGDKRYEDNLYARTILGQESDIDMFTQYVEYIVEISRSKFAGPFNQGISETFDYHIAVPVGRHDDVEALINNLAGGAGVEVVKAYGE